jgi:hypothetical protein
MSAILASPKRPPSSNRSRKVRPTMSGEFKQNGINASVMTIIEGQMPLIRPLIKFRVSVREIGNCRYENKKLNETNVLVACDLFVAH